MVCGVLCVRESRACVGVLCVVCERERVCVVLCVCVVCCEREWVCGCGCGCVGVWLSRLLWWCVGGCGVRCGVCVCVCV